MPRKRTSRREKITRRLNRKVKVPTSRMRYLQREERQSRFPNICYVNRNSPDYLESRVRGILDHLIVSDELPARLRNDLEAFASGRLKVDVNPHEHPVMRLGQSVYERLMTAFQSTIQWGDDVSIDPDPKLKGGIRITLQSMEKFKSHEYSSPLAPTIVIANREYRVAFSKHAIEQLAGRLTLDLKLYIDWGLITGVLYKTKFFEVVQAGEQVMLSLWDRCDPMTTIGGVHLELAGELALAGSLSGIFPIICTPGGQVFYYRLGYCPIEIDDKRGIVTLVTLLLPGMDNTPEFNKFSTQPRTHAELREFQRQVAQTARVKLQESGNFELIPRLHELVPQVRVIDEAVFDEEGDFSPSVVRKHFREAVFVSVGREESNKGRPVD